MKAADMGIVARLADHYGKAGLEKEFGEDGVLQLAEQAVAKFKREAPELWDLLYYHSMMPARQMGDWIYKFMVKWSSSGQSFKNFAADWAERKNPLRI